MTDVPPRDNGAMKKSQKSKKVSDTNALVQWLKEQGAVEDVSYDEDTGHPMRRFTIDLREPKEK